MLTIQGKSGTFKLFYLVQNSYGEWITYQKTFDVGTSSDDLKDGLYSLPNMRHKREVELVKYNAEGNIEADDALVVKYVYTIKILQYRDQDTAMPRVDGSKIDGEGMVTPSITIEKTVPHSPPLSGTAKYLIDGVALQKPDGSDIFDSSTIYYSYAYYLSWAINKKF